MTMQTGFPGVVKSHSLSARATSRGVTATWWYTASAIVFFELALVLIWTATLRQSELEGVPLGAVFVGGLLWSGSTVPLLLAYRHRTGAATSVQWRGILTPLLAAIGYGVLAFSLSGLWLLMLAPLAQTLQLLDWPRAVRTRQVLAITVLLACLWVVDANVAFSGPLAPVTDYFLFGFTSTALPLATVLSLWWWDVLVALDRARVSEARLAATQERLNLAIDVHDLQGHHLQVIALQLELTDRLLLSDRDAALEHLRAARISVDEARQGTRDLATRFRSVPLLDELANARDLLRAAGIAAETIVTPQMDGAPASLFGPVIRETTTNVLRHGSGKHASLRLSRADNQWRYEISNDVDAPTTPFPTGTEPRDIQGREGTGLEGLTRRAREAGGTLEVVRGESKFTVIVTAPTERRVG